jgi:hypothetical protein
MSIPDRSAPVARQDPVAFAFLIAMGLAAAVVSGAALSGIASGAVQDLWRIAGFGQDSEIKTEQRRQAMALAGFEASLGAVRSEVATLNARSDIGQTLRQDAVQLNSGAGVEQAEVAGLRSSLDAHEERNRHEFIAVNKRLDWLETLIYSPDVTGSVSPATPPRRGRQSAASGWFVLHAEDGVAVLSGKTGTIDVTPGFVIPELGRVAAIRQEGRHWVVVTDKATIRER